MECALQLVHGDVGRVLFAALGRIWYMYTCACSAHVHLCMLSTCTLVHAQHMYTCACSAHVHLCMLSTCTLVHAHALSTSTLVHAQHSCQGAKTWSSTPENSHHLRHSPACPARLLQCPCQICSRQAPCSIFFGGERPCAPSREGVVYTHLSMNNKHWWLGSLDQHSSTCSNGAKTKCKTRGFRKRLIFVHFVKSAELRKFVFTNRLFHTYFHRRQAQTYEITRF